MTQPAVVPRRPLRRACRPRVGLVAALAAAGLALASCGDDPAAGVELAAAVRADVVETVEAPGAVTPRAAATLTAPADGTVVEVAAEPGESVLAGGLLLRLDSPAARDRLAVARDADAAAARGARVSAPAEADLDALQRASDAAAAASAAAGRDAAALLPEGPARDTALERVALAEAQYAAARQAATAAARGVESGLREVGEAVSALGAAQRVQTRAAVDLAEQAVAALEVRSPITGVVQLAGSRTVGGAGGVLGALPPDLAAAAGALPGAGGDAAPAAALAVGAPVGAGEPLVTVVDVSELGVVAEVDETDVLRVAPGAAATVELDALPGSTYDATVTSLDVEPGTSAVGGVAYRVRLALGAGATGDGAPAPRPLPGMSAVVDVEVARAEGAVAVPVSAVQFGAGTRGAGEASVWVAADGVAERRRVELGPEGEDLVVVSAGLEPGEQVVVGGADAVREGLPLPDAR